jgi:flagellar capping protein FliD
MKITKSQLKELIKEELESVTEMFGRDLDDLPTYDDDISQNVFSPEEGIDAAKQIQTAAARLKQVIEGLKQKAGGMEYDSMDLALGSLKNMKVEYYLDRIIDRLERFK